MEGLCAALGLHGRRNGDQLLPLNPVRRDRNPGSFVIYLHGSRAGRWDEFATADFRTPNDGGDALDLVAYLQYGNPSSKEAKKHALAWAKRWLGLADTERMTGGSDRLEAARKLAEQRRQEAHNETAAAIAKQRRSAFRIWTEAQPLKAPGPTEKSSPAWAYFNECRGLPLEQLPRLPRSVKFSLAQRHVETDRIVPAIISAMWDPETADLVAIHRIFLEPDGLAKIKVDPGIAQKKIWPRGWVGSFIPISYGATGLPISKAAEKGLKDEVLFVEGVEDGFTAALLVPEWRVHVVGALRNFASQTIPATARAVIGAKDNDPDPRARKAAKEVFAALREKAEAAGAQFFETRAKGAKDFNDMVRA